MTSLTMPICMVCKHYRRDYTGWGYRCDAFPDGIPKLIIESEVDHREAIDGDHGIQFEPVDKRGAEYAARLFGDEAPSTVAPADVA